MDKESVSFAQETEYSVSCVERENPLTLSIYSIWLIVTFFKHSLEGFLRFGKSSQLSFCPFLVKILNGQIYDFFSGF